MTDVPAWLLELEDEAMASIVHHEHEGPVGRHPEHRPAFVEPLGCPQCRHARHTELCVMGRLGPDGPCNCPAITKRNTL